MTLVVYLLNLAVLIAKLCDAPAVSETNCTVLRDVFANSTAEFNACAIYNSRPITLCESCVDSYIKVLDSYNNMTKFSDNETACIDNFINLDRLQIVETSFSSSCELWNRAKCYECFQVINGRISPNRSVETLTFNKHYNQLMQCVNGSNINDTNLCPTCLHDYDILNNYYNSISNENEKIGVCMDIVDLMNTTRSFWSAKCCAFRKHSEYAFLFSTMVVLILPVLFYATAQVCTEKRFPIIMQQTRFGGSLSETIDSQ